jgi:hypothetical protein
MDKHHEHNKYKASITRPVLMLCMDRVKCLLGNLQS